jgi:hypothetical protein
MRATAERPTWLTHLNQHSVMVVAFGGAVAANARAATETLGIVVTHERTKVCKTEIGRNDGKGNSRWVGRQRTTLPFFAPR